jgi:hypothetical protein
MERQYNCQVPGLHRVEVQRPIFMEPAQYHIYTIAVILSLSKIISQYSRYLKEGLVYIAIAGQELLTGTSVLSVKLG